MSAPAFSSPTGTSALALARHASNVPCDGFGAPLAKILDPLPMEALTGVGQHQPTLARVGCRTLGDVRNLPRGGLSRRFDKALLLALPTACVRRPTSGSLCPRRSTRGWN
jgi:protein ImuB